MVYVYCCEYEKMPWLVGWFPLSTAFVSGALLRKADAGKHALVWLGSPGTFAGSGRLEGGIYSRLIMTGIEHST